MMRAANAFTRAVWRDLLESWDQVENFIAYAEDFDQIVRSIRHSYRQWYTPNHDSDNWPSDTLLRIALKYVDWRWVTEKLLKMRARQECLEEERREQDAG